MVNVCLGPCSNGWKFYLNLNQNSLNIFFVCMKPKSATETTIFKKSNI